LQIANEIKRNLLAGTLRDGIIQTLAFKYQPQELYFTLQYPPVSQRTDSQLLQIIVLQHQQTVALDVLLPKVLDAVTEAYLVEPTPDITAIPIVDCIDGTLPFFLSRDGSI
jgi:hypothetical protein